MLFINKNKNLLYKRFLASLIDITIIYIASYVVRYIIRYMARFDFDPPRLLMINSFIIVSIVYFILTISLKKKTPGKSLTAITINASRKNNIPLMLILFLREFVFKHLIGFLLPLYLLSLAGFNSFLLDIVIAFFITCVFALISLLIFKEALWDKLSGTHVAKISSNTKIINNLLLRTSSWIIDAGIVFSMSLLIDLIIHQYIYIEILNIFLLILVAYTIIAYKISGQTPGKYLLNLSVVFIDENKPTILDIVKRELIYKYGVSIVLPFLVLYLIGYPDYYLIMAIIFVVFVLFFLIYFFLFHHTWWETLSNIHICTINANKKHTQYFFIILCVFWISSYLIIKSNNNKDVPESVKSLLGFKIPFPKEYPHNKRVNKYVEFISENGMNPVDYIFKLYEDYDIVILCERMHPELSQWNLIYDIASDDRFIKNVGHIFTEYGANNKQYLLDQYLNTQYKNDTLLDKATANIMPYVGGVWPLWENTNYFRFLKKINILNSTLPDSLMIRGYFTDIDHIWDSIKTQQEWNALFYINRDSIMAQNVIKRYKNIKKNDNRKKCLIITNYRHAFGILRKNKNLKNISIKGNEAQYIINEYPKQTATVLINTLKMNNFYMLSPIQYGSWDKAFSLLGNRATGFDFSGSPMGDDFFDMFPSLGNMYRFKYSDIFTGFIFWKPIKEWIAEYNYPYMMNGFEKEYIRRLCISGRDTVNIQHVIDLYKKEIYSQESKQYLDVLNSIFELVIFVFLSGLSFLISIYYVARISFKRKL